MRQARRLTGSCPTIRDRNRHGRPCCGEVGWVKDGRHMAIQPDITRSGDGSRTDRRPGASHWTGCRGDRHGGRAGAATALRLKMFLHDTQGSSFLATLGFGPESLWDSKPSGWMVHACKIREGCLKSMCQRSPSPNPLPKERAFPWHVFRPFVHPPDQSSGLIRETGGNRFPLSSGERAGVRAGNKTNLSLSVAAMGKRRPPKNLSKFHYTTPNLMWGMTRAEARTPFREPARREHLPMMAEGIYGR